MSSFRLRDYTPRGLYARLAALVAVPVIAIFAIFSLYYYQEHISDVNEKLSQSIAREVGLIVDICADPNHDLAMETDIEAQLGLRLDCAHPKGMTWPDNARTRFSYGNVLREIGRAHV